MPLISTQDLRPGELRSDTLQIYNGLDAMITFEVFEALGQLFNEEPLMYNFERALQAPALEMMLRGFRIDETERQSGIRLLNDHLTQLNNILQQYAFAVWDKPLNPRSHKQMIDFFYGAMALPEIWTSKKGERKLSMDREALEKLEVYFYAMPIIACILQIRDITKQLEVLQTEIDSDGRMRTSYNIAGTDTDRWSSSANAFGTGTNLQNIRERLRKIFISDPGWKLCGIDLEQTESRDVGWIVGTQFNDWAYLDACEAGDLHTTVCQMVWPELPWTADKRKNREIAEAPFYRDYSYRYMAKRGGHGCLTEDHEVLTPSGWVPIRLHPPVIMGWNVRGGSQFEQVEKWTDFAYTGDLHSFEGNSISTLMTADHRMPFTADQKSKVFKTKFAAEGPGASIPLGYGFSGGPLNVPARLVAAFMSDGHQKSTNVMEFHFKKERKIKRLFALCSQYGYEAEQRGDKIFVKGNLPKECGPFMFQWEAQCLDDFLDEYKFWDGHEGVTKSVTLFSVNRQQLEWIQTFGRIRGKGGQIQQPYQSGFGSTVWRLQQNNRKFASGSSIKWTKFPVTAVRVICPTVRSSWFYVRRNGKIFVTGNSNYLGTPWTMARHLKVPVKVVERFQNSYFTAFPGIPRWHRWVAEQIQTVGKISDIFGRSRTFFGRPNDDTTIRAAVAHGPQSTTAKRLNLGLYRIWKEMGQQIQILAQVHDAVYFQYRVEDGEQEIISRALKLIEVEHEHNGRKMIVPGEAKVGWNWGNHHDESKPTGPSNLANPNGLKKWKGTDKRQRLEGLDRVL